MTMSLKEFKEFFLENILRFLWRQWSAMGLLGEARGEDNWVIDPEALLVFTLPIARYEPRLFDEVMDWLCVNGDRLDVQRIRTILKDKDAATHRLLGATLKAPRAGSKDRKWDGLIAYCAKPEFKGQDLAPLFPSKEGPVTWSSPNIANREFTEFGFNRGLITMRGMSREVKPNAKMNLRFMLRGLFGIGSRSECILYLITHEAGHPSEISEAVGTSYLATQQMLQELSSSGLVLTRTMAGKKIQYWVSDRWWGFLSGPFGNFFKPPFYINWIALFHGLSVIWNGMTELDDSKSDYIRSSKMRDAFDKVKNEFAKSGIPVPFVPAAETTPEAYEQAIQNFISQIFGKQI